MDLQGAAMSPQSARRSVGQGMSPEAASRAAAALSQSQRGDLLRDFAEAGAAAGAAAEAAEQEAEAQEEPVAADIGEQRAAGHGGARGGEFASRASASAPNSPPFDSEAARRGIQQMRTYYGDSVPLHAYLPKRLVGPSSPPLTTSTSTVFVTKTIQ